MKTRLDDFLYDVSEREGLRGYGDTYTCMRGGYGGAILSASKA